MKDKKGAGEEEGGGGGKLPATPNTEKTTFKKPSLFGLILLSSLEAFFTKYV